MTHCSSRTMGVSPYGDRTCWVDERCPNLHLLDLQYSILVSDILDKHAEVLYWRLDYCITFHQQAYTEKYFTILAIWNFIYLRFTLGHLSLQTAHDVVLFCRRYVRMLRGSVTRQKYPGENANDRRTTWQTISKLLEFCRKRNDGKPTV